MEWVACVGLDWGEKQHAYEIDDGHGRRTTGVIDSSPEDIHAWVRNLRERFPRGTIVIGVEQSRGSVIYALSMYEFIVLVPINPRASKAYRDSRRLSGASSDGSDARLICEFVIKHIGDLRVWKADDALTRKLRLLSEARRGLVDQRTAFTHALSATLKSYFPQALEWFGGESSKLLRAMLGRWATLDEMRTATREQLGASMKSCRCRNISNRVTELVANIKSAVVLTHDSALLDAQSLYAQTLIALIDPLEDQIAKHDRAIAEAWTAHPDSNIFDSLPGAGPVLAPRLAVAFGQDRDRYDTANEMQCYSGIAPVIEQSGRSIWIHARHACPKFLRQTFHEFAAASIPHSPWAAVVYQEQRARGAGHHAAVRALAFRWIRILFRLWKDRRPYDEKTHLEHLVKTQSPIAKRIAA